VRVTGSRQPHKPVSALLPDPAASGTLQACSQMASGASSTRSQPNFARTRTSPSSRATTGHRRGGAARAGESGGAPCSNGPSSALTRGSAGTAPASTPHGQTHLPRAQPATDVGGAANARVAKCSPRCCPERRSAGCWPASKRATQPDLVARLRVAHVQCRQRCQSSACLLVGRRSRCADRKWISDGLRVLVLPRSA